MHREHTSTVYLLDEDRVLLLFHPKFRLWLPPGGHAEANETPIEAARREVMEETGFTFEVIKQENVWIERWNAHSVERPYLCLLEEIPAFGNKPAHQHIDSIFLGRPLPNRTLNGSNKTARWFSMEEVLELVPDQEIFAETQEIIFHLLSPVCQLR